MAQMGFAHGTHGFGTQHTVGAVNPFFDGGWVRSLVKAGPAAARVKFGAGVEQPGITANALVGTFRPMRFITARIGGARWRHVGSLHKQRVRHFWLPDAHANRRCFEGIS